MLTWKSCRAEWIYQPRLMHPQIHPILVDKNRRRRYTRSIILETVRGNDAGITKLELYPPTVLL